MPNLKRKTSWDDLRIFVAVANSGSISRAVGELKISRSTIWRHLKSLSETLEAKLLDVSRDGVQLTDSGKEVFEQAQEMEAQVLTIERRLVGRESDLLGSLTITMPEIMVTDLLMPDVSAFGAAYPEIDVVLSSSHRPYELDRRQADVAIRVSSSPPDNLMGRKVIRGAIAEYASREYLERHDVDDPETDAVWIGNGRAVPSPKWVASSSVPHAQARHAARLSFEHMAMIRAGMGMAVLPCFYGDAQPDIRRLPGSKPVPAFDIWLLFHPDTKDSARVRAFTKFMADAIKSKRALIQGELPQN